MKKHYERLERFFEQMKDREDQPQVAAYKYKVYKDEIVNCFNINLHYLNSDGGEIEEGQIKPIRVIENAYDERLRDPGFNADLLDVFKYINKNGKHPFTKPTYVSFEDDEQTYHIQALEE